MANVSSWRLVVYSLSRGGRLPLPKAAFTVCTHPGAFRNRFGSLPRRGSMTVCEAGTHDQRLPAHPSPLQPPWVKAVFVSFVPGSVEVAFICRGTHSTHRQLSLPCARRAGITWEAPEVCAVQPLPLLFFCRPAAPPAAQPPDVPEQLGISRVAAGPAQSSRPTCRNNWAYPGWRSASLRRAGLRLGAGAANNRGSVRQTSDENPNVVVSAIR